MTVAHSIPKRVGLATESTFAEPPSDWTLESQFYCFDVNIEGLKQAMVENANYRVRVNDPHEDVPGLKNGAFSFGQYISGIPTSAAAGAQCPDTPYRVLLQTALGGAKRGYAAAFTGGGTQASPELDTDANVDVDDWIGFYDDSEAKLTFHRITAKPGANIIDVDPALPAAPTASDLAKAVLMVYFDQDSLTKHDDAGHITLSLLFRGEEGPDDVYEARGCKLALALDAIQQGALLTGRYEGQCATFDHETLTNPALTGTPSGNDPIVSSTGDSTTVKMADVGSALADVPVLGSLEPTIGITHKPVPGVNGNDGVHGYVGDGWGECGVAFSTYHAKAYRSEYIARTRKHLLVQIGNASERAVGLYWPNLSYKEDPGRGMQTDLTASRLVFRAHERSASTELGRSSFVLLLAN